MALNSYAALKRWDGYYKTGTGDINTIYTPANGEDDGGLVKNARAGKVDYARGKSTDDARAIKAIDGTTMTTTNIYYTRCFYTDRLLRNVSVKQDDWTVTGR